MLKQRDAELFLKEYQIKIKENKIQNQRNVRIKKRTEDFKEKEKSQGFEKMRKNEIEEIEKPTPLLELYDNHLESIILNDWFNTDDKY